MKYRLPILFGAITLVLAVVGTVLLVRASDLRNAPAVTNRAVVAQSETTEVITQVSTGLNQVLSYDYAKPQVSQRAAKRWLAGDAPSQYRTLFTELQKLAPGQKLTFVAKVVVGGVRVLRGDHAHLLVFLDQRSTRASDGQSSVSAAQVEITAHKQGSRWLITGLQPI